MCSDPWKPTAEDQASCDADDLLPAGQVPGLVEWAGSFCILRHSDADVRAMNVRHPAAPQSFLQGNRRSVTITKNPLSACVFTITIRPLSNRHQGGILLRTPATVHATRYLLFDMAYSTSSLFGRIVTVLTIEHSKISLSNCISLRCWSMYATHDMSGPRRDLA
jgi:hypothetical protein